MRVVMIVIMVVVLMIMVMIVMVMVNSTLGFKRTRHVTHDTAKTARHLGCCRIGLDVKSIRGDFARHMIATEVKSGLQQASRIFSTHLDQRLRFGFDKDERTIFKLQRVTVIQRGHFLKGDRKACTLFTRQRRILPLPLRVSEKNRLHDIVGFDGRLPHNRCRALHEIIPFKCHAGTLMQKIPQCQYGSASGILRFNAVRLAGCFFGRTGFHKAHNDAGRKNADDDTERPDRRDLIETKQICEEDLRSDDHD